MPHVRQYTLISLLPAETFIPWDICAPYANPSGDTCPESALLYRVIQFSVLILGHRKHRRGERPFAPTRSRFQPVCVLHTQLLALVRGHWHIENKSNGVRYVTFDEDRSQVRCGHIPHVMAAIRNTAIGLLRSAGYTNIAKACRLMAAQPQRALALIGIEIEN